MFIYRSTGPTSIPDRSSVMFWTPAIAVSLIAVSNTVTSWAYLYPEQFKHYFGQDDLIRFWFTLNLVILALYFTVCSGAKFNVSGLWMSLPCAVLGAFLVGYAYSKLGPTRTFFGVELGVIEGEETVNEFPFTLGHPQYKGAIIFLFGVWCAFRHTAELTILTGIWIVSFMLQIMVEAAPVVETVAQVSQ
jgi:hypothetical protein